MKKVVFLLFLAVVAAIATLSISAADSMMSSSGAAPTIVTADSLKWSPVKGVAGAQMAVVWGDPTKAGFYTVRMKLADGTKVPVHMHDDSERLTVLEGTMMVAAGSKWDATKMTSVGEHSFVYIPANVYHYAMAKGDTMIQISGAGPMTMNTMK